MTVEGYCARCARTVQLEDGSEPVCPVCGMSLRNVREQES